MGFEQVVNEFKGSSFEELRDGFDRFCLKGRSMETSGPRPCSPVLQVHRPTSTPGPSNLRLMACREPPSLQVGAGASGVEQLSSGLSARSSGSTKAALGESSVAIFVVRSSKSGFV